MTALNTQIKLYLERYGEPVASDILASNCAPKALGTDQAFERVIIIPCFDENPDFAERLMRSPLWLSNVLVIIVINQAEQTAPTEANLKLWQWFRGFQISALTEQLIFCQDTKQSTQISGSGFLILDCFQQHALPPKQGVGLARKLGCDIALALVYQGCLKPGWLYSSDADAHLPDNYLQTPPSIGYSAQVFNFSHRNIEACSEEVMQATQDYELSLRYYRQALQWAGSNYAFFTIGSALAIDMQSYLKVRGFPKRAAAEDFYLLNKLLKVAPIHQNDQIEIKLAARISQRAPFGTGQAVKNIVEAYQRGEDYYYYNPQCFALLKQFLLDKNELWQKDLSIPKHWPDQLKQILNRLQFNLALQHFRKQVKNSTHFEKAFHDWFDGFKTLKFIRIAQELFYPAIKLQDAVKQLEHYDANSISQFPSMPQAMT